MGISLWPKGGVKKKTISLHGGYTKGSHEIDLRQELIDLLGGTNSKPQRGHWVLLRRMETIQRCSCWNERGTGTEKYSYDERKYDEGKEDCAYCGGIGWLFDDELHLTRRRIISPPIGLAGQERQEEIGIINIPYLVYYFEYYVNPNKRDIIIEITNDRDGEPVRPFVNEKYYNIAVAEPLRDQKGRIEFWRCAVKMEAI